MGSEREDVSPYVMFRDIFLDGKMDGWTDFLQIWKLMKRLFVFFFFFFYSNVSQSIFMPDLLKYNK